MNYEALFDYRIRPSVAALAKDSMSSWPSIQMHNEVLMEPYRQIGRAGGKRLNAYKLDVILQYRLCYSAGNSHSWLAGLRSIRFPFMSWEFTRVVLTLPWRLRRTLVLSLRVIRRLNPLLSEIPNDTGAPMIPLGLGSGTAYARMGMATTFHKARARGWASAGPAWCTEDVQPEATARLMGGMSHRFGASALLVRPGRCSGGLDGAMSPAPSPKEIKALYGLLTLELLLSKFPNLTKELVFREEGCPSTLLP